jgi:hypothetical protein
MAKREPQAKTAELLVKSGMPDGFLGPAGGITDATALEFLVGYFDALDEMKDPEQAASWMAQEAVRDGYRRAINRTGGLIQYIEQCEAWIHENKEKVRKLEDRTRLLANRVDQIKTRIGRAARDKDLTMVEVAERKLRIQDYPTALIDNSELLPAKFCKYRVNFEGSVWPDVEAVVGLFAEKVTREPMVSLIVEEFKRLQAEALQLYPGDDEQTVEKRRMFVVQGVPGARPDPNPRLVITAG